MFRAVDAAGGYQEHTTTPPPAFAIAGSTAAALQRQGASVPGWEVGGVGLVLGLVFVPVRGNGVLPRAEKWPLSL